MIETTLEARPAAPARVGRPEAKFWRLSPSLRKLLVAVHVIASVVWLGIVLVRLVLAVTATTTPDANLIHAVYLIVDLVDRTVLWPAAIGALVSGVILSVGTPWGLLDHYWIVVKLGITIAAIVTGFLLVDRWVAQAIVATSGLTANGMPASPGVAATLLIRSSIAHAIVLTAATVISSFKPWGKTPLGRRRSARRQTGA
ncbi:MAG: DUF2269 family protein [Chloroflexi bacterium]|nr:DUF2269 family protein [Chloroflexota bacterium]